MNSDTHLALAIFIHSWYVAFIVLWVYWIIRGQLEDLPCNMYGPYEQAQVNLAHALFGTKLNFFATFGLWVLGMCLYWFLEKNPYVLFAPFFGWLKIILTPPLIYDVEDLATETP